MNRLIRTIAAAGAAFALTACGQNTGETPRITTASKPQDVAAAFANAQREMDSETPRNVARIKEYQGRWYIFDYEADGRMRDFGVLSGAPAMADVAELTMKLNKNTGISTRPLTQIERDKVEALLKDLSKKPGTPQAELQPSTSITQTLS
jgi:hypothetical protein